MLFKSQNRQKWEVFKSQVPNEWKKIIEECLIRNHIDYDRWAINMDCLDYWSEYSPEGRIAQAGLADIIRKNKRYEMPLGTPDWFLAAFPDVWLWMEKNPEVFRELRSYEDNPLYFGESGPKLAFYNLLVDIRKRKTGFSPSLTNTDVF